MEMIEVKTSELIGAALDRAVEMALGGVRVGHRLALPCGYWCLGLWRPSIDWGHGGPLIEKFILDLKFCVFELPNESWKAETHESWANGSTALIASMRAIVHVNFGDTVSVPKELMQ